MDIYIYTPYETYKHSQLIIQSFTSVEIEVTSTLGASSSPSFGIASTTPYSSKA